MFLLFLVYIHLQIQTLNSCECKLCRYCLKQNFEVAIREKYVRNWGCPLCQAPNLEDEFAAQSYFEFLQMLVNKLCILFTRLYNYATIFFNCKNDSFRFKKKTYIPVYSTSLA